MGGKYSLSLSVINLNNAYSHCAVLLKALIYERLTNWANLNYENTQKMNSQSIIKARHCQNKTYYLLRFSLIQISSNFCRYEVRSIEMVVQSLKVRLKLQLIDWLIDFMYFFHVLTYINHNFLHNSSVTWKGGACSHHSFYPRKDVHTLSIVNLFFKNTIPCPYIVYFIRTYYMCHRLMIFDNSFIWNIRMSCLVHF